MCLSNSNDIIDNDNELQSIYLFFKSKCKSIVDKI